MPLAMWFINKTQKEASFTGKCYQSLQSNIYTSSPGSAANKAVAGRLQFTLRAFHACVLKYGLELYARPRLLILFVLKTCLDLLALFCWKNRREGGGGQRMAR